MQVLLTGGAGYIGSHTAVELLNENHEVIIVDNLNNSSLKTIENIEEITGKKLITYQVDILDEVELNKVFKNHSIDAVIHFAGLKAVGESVEQPLKYYSNNVSGTINLCKVMAENNVFNLIFSSSATVYGISDDLPFAEDAPTNAINPYGNSKLICEEILTDLSQSNENWKIAILRYFNPIGAHPSGLIGENPNGIPNNLMPYITKVASGELEYLKVYGDDYPTHDGTGVRDYIHVVDLALGHIAALNNISEFKVAEIFNLGTGEGYSVMDVVNTFEEVTLQKIPYKIVERRAGDAAFSYAKVKKSFDLLNWKTSKKLAEMCYDAWIWTRKDKVNKL